MNIIEKQKNSAIELQSELKSISSPRAKSLLLTNYADSLLNDFMEELLSSEKARNIPRDIIINILKEKKILPDDLGADIRSTLKIRDAYAHRIILKEANDYVEQQIIPNMNCVKNEASKVTDWDKKDIHEKIEDIANWIIVQMIYKFDEMKKS